MFISVVILVSTYVLLVASVLETGESGKVIDLLPLYLGIVYSTTGISL